jgi:hypothetical protein
MQHTISGSYTCSKPSTERIMSSSLLVRNILRVCLVLKIVLVIYQFPTCLNVSETSLTCEIYTAQRLFLFVQMVAAIGIINQAIETLEMVFELKVTSKVMNFLK